MVRIILSGCNGQMGKVITESVGKRDDCEIVAGIDPTPSGSSDYKVFGRAADCDAKADVLVDFSHPVALEGVLNLCVRRGIPVVIATTGINEAQVSMIKAAARKIPVFFTANMSLGVSLMVELAKTAARVLGSEFDIEIVEKHHNRKIDAPSGTALMLADEIASALKQPPKYVYNRHTQRRRRSKSEIGIHAIRGGTIPGDHDVLFAGEDEVLTISHSAGSKSVFATGAVNAAIFLHDKPAGLYNMKNLI